MDVSNGSSSESLINSGSEDSREAFQLEDYEGMIQPLRVKETDSEADNVAIEDESSHQGSESVCSRLADIRLVILLYILNNRRNRSVRL